MLSPRAGQGPPTEMSTLRFHPLVQWLREAPTPLIPASLSPGFCTCAPASCPHHVPWKVPRDPQFARGLICFVTEPATAGIRPSKVHSTGFSTLLRILGGSPWVSHSFMEYLPHTRPYTRNSGHCRGRAHRLSEQICNNCLRDFPGCPVVKALNFHCRGCGFEPWSGNKYPTCCVSRPKEINKQNSVSN